MASFKLVSRGMNNLLFISATAVCFADGIGGPYISLFEVNSVRASTQFTSKSKKLGMVKTRSHI